MIRPGKDSENIELNEVEKMTKEDAVLDNEQVQEDVQTASNFVNEEEDTKDTQESKEVSEGKAEADDEVTESPAYQAYMAAVENEGFDNKEKAAASSAVRSSDKTLKKEKAKKGVLMGLAAVAAAATLFFGVFWGIDAKNVRSVAEEYHNTTSAMMVATVDDVDGAEKLVNGAGSQVDDMLDYYANQTNADGILVYEGEDGKFYFNNTNGMSARSNPNNSNGIIETVVNEYNYAADNLNQAKNTLSEMQVYEGENSIERLNREFEAGNWSKVNEIGASITANAEKISQLTLEITNSTTAIGEAYQNFKAETGTSYQSIAEEYANTTIPNLNVIIEEDLSAIQESVNLIANYVERIEQTSASEAVKEAISIEHQNAIKNQNSANAELETFNNLLAQFEEAYVGGDYSLATNLGQQLIDSAAKINAYAENAHNSSLSAARQFADYQESANSPVFEVEFTQTDLQNPEIVKYLRNPSLRGHVVSIDQAQYNKTNGEVSILVTCEDGFGNPYTNLIETNIAVGLTGEQLSSRELINRIKDASNVTSTVFNLDLENVAGSGSMGAANVGQSNEVSGNVDVQYSISTSYNKKTNKTLIQAQAIVIIKDADGNILNYSIYKTDPVSRTGNIQEDEALRQEFSSKLAQKISTDPTLEIEDSELGF